jgi:hypothetical protein
LPPTDEKTAAGTIKNFPSSIQTEKTFSKNKKFPLDKGEKAAYNAEQQQTYEAEE